MKPRFSLLIGLLVLGLGGCSAVYCARAYGENPWFFVQRQLLWLVIGILLFFCISKVPFPFWKRYCFPICIGFFILLLLTALFTSPVNGMRGWISFPFWSIRLQPSELAKMPYLLLLCLIAQREEWTERARFWRMCGIAVLFCGVILIQPDFGTASVYALMLPVVLFASGFRFRWIGIFIGAMLAGAGVFTVLHPYAIRRISAFLNPEADLYGAGWHIQQFRLTMANGGWFGSGEEGALWANAYLPLSHSDSVFASLTESAGTVGGLLVLFCFPVFLHFCRKASLKLKEPDAALFLYSSGMMIAVQAFLHIGVNVTMLPPTGLPLPFFSYGGSCLTGTMLLLGTALSAYEADSSVRENLSSKESL